MAASGPPDMLRITSVAVLSDWPSMSEKRLSTVMRTDRAPDQAASGLWPARNSSTETTTVSAGSISPRSTRRRNSSAMGTLDTLAIGKGWSPLNEIRAPDSTCNAETPTASLTPARDAAESLVDRIRHNARRPHGDGARNGAARGPSCATARPEDARRRKLAAREVARRLTGAREMDGRTCAGLFAS